MQEEERKKFFFPICFLFLLHYPLIPEDTVDSSFPFLLAISEPVSCCLLRASIWEFWVPVLQAPHWVLLGISADGQWSFLWDMGPTIYGIPPLSSWGPTTGRSVHHTPWLLLWAAGFQSPQTLPFVSPIGRDGSCFLPLPLSVKLNLDFDCSFPSTPASPVPHQIFSEGLNAVCVPWLLTTRSKLVNCPCECLCEELSSQCKEQVQSP